MNCGALYTADFCCSKGGLEDKILVPKPHQNCATCGNPVDGLYCRHCVFVRKCLNEGWYTIHDENEILNTFESSNHNTNVVSTSQEPFVFNQDPGVNSSQSPLQSNHNCCYKCGDSLDDIFCQQCTCKSCGNGAHIGYNCPPKALIISNPEQCNQTINELPQTLPSVHPTCNYEDENSFTYDSKPNSFNDSPSVLTHPPQLQFETYLCELCGNNAHYGYDCPPQFPLVYEQEPCYNQNFNDNYFPQNSQSSSQQYNCCENCGGPHETFHCQPMNEDYYEQNSCYDPNSFGFDQFQPPQFPVNYPPQETSKEIFQAREDLMEAIQAFLKEYDHIPPNEKCMALLLAEERFRKIKQAMEEEQNQPGVMQELLLKLIDNFLKDVCTFLRKLSRIPFGVTPKVILIAWESFGKIKDALMDKQYQQKDIQELMSKLLKDVRNISEEFSEYISYPSWNRPLFYFYDDDDEYTVIWRKPKAITLDEPSEEPEDPLITKEEELSTIPEKDKSSVEDLVPILSGSKGFSNDICDDESLLSRDIPITSPKIDFLYEEFAGELAPIPPGMNEDKFDEEEDDCYDDDTSSNDDSYKNIDYVEASPPDSELVNLEEVEDVILHDKLSNVYLLISKIEALNDNPTLFSFSYYDNSFSDHTKETRTGSTTTHAKNSLPEYDSFLFEIEPGQGRLTSVVISDNSNDPLLELPEFESFHFDLDPSFPRPPPEPPDVEINLIIETDKPEINNFDELNEDECFDPGGDENNVEVDDSFTFVTWTFLPFLTYPLVSLEEKLLNVHRLITNIESLKDNPIRNRVLKSPSLVPIFVTDSGSFFEESDIFLSHLDNSLPEFKTFTDTFERDEIVGSSYHYHANKSLPSTEPPDVEISLIVETNAPVINNIGEINVEDDDSFTFVIWAFLPFLTYPVDNPFLYSFGNEDTIFDPGIST
ncbi:hypothetical protein Tco_0098901 [Tanacetum coccineum]